MSPSPALIWFLVGVVFLLAEMFAPGFILVFFAAGSWVAALAAWLLGVDATTQVIVFIVASLFFLLTLRRLGLNTFKGKTHDTIEEDFAESATGKSAVVTKTITPNVAGEIKFRGSFWRAVADTEIEAGQSVSIVGQDADDRLTFKVRAV